jgi:hypothetical protein
VKSPALKGYSGKGSPHVPKKAARMTLTQKYKNVGKCANLF